MLLPTTYRATQTEREAVEMLLAPYREKGVSVSVSRTEPGETGPLRVEVVAPLTHELAWLVHEDGSVVADSPNQHEAPAP